MRFENHQWTQHHPTARSVWSARDTATGPARYWYTRLTNYTGERFASGTNGIPATYGIKTCPAFGRLGACMMGGGETATEIVAGYAYNNTGFNPLAGKELGLGGLVLRPGAPPDNTVRPGGVRLTRDTDVVCPSDMIAIGDSQLSAININPLGTIAWTSTRFPDMALFDSVLVELGLPTVAHIGDAGAGARFIRNRHSGRWNIQFCDGHTQSFRTKVLFDYHSDVVLQRWSRDHVAHAESLRGLP